MIQLLFILLKKPIKHDETTVYSLLLVCALALSSYTFYQQFVAGMDNLKLFVLNIAALLVSGTNVIYDMLRGYRRNKKN
jgi:hypothetical protein